MWDIKKIKRLYNSVFLYFFHLNHVGYKVLEFVATDAKGKDFHLNHVGYKVFLETYIA